MVARCPACSRVWGGEQCLACGHRAGEVTVVTTPAALVVAAERTVVALPVPAPLPVAATDFDELAPISTAAGPVAEVARSPAAVSSDTRGSDDVEQLRIDQRRASTLLARLDAMIAAQRGQD